MGLELRYFVLKPKAKTYDDVFAYASQMAMRCFADFIEPSPGGQPLADDLRAWADREHTAQNKLIETDLKKVPDALYRDLETRVQQFEMLNLPGQPKSMHMGTARLIDDLWRTIKNRCC